MGFLSSLIKGFTSSDAIFMWVILALQIASITIIIERFIALYLKNNDNSEALIQNLSLDIRSGDIQKAYKKASQLATQHPAGRLAETALGASLNFSGREEITTRLQEALYQETTLIEKRTGFLSVFANVATLMGLLGTIAGLIAAFVSIGNMNGAEKATLLSNGIALAMNTTAYGLIVAIPSMIMYAVLQNRTTQLTEDLNKASMKILIQLGFQNEISGHFKKAK